MSTRTLTAAPGLLTRLRQEWDHHYAALPHELSDRGEFTCGEIAAQLRAAAVDEADAILHQLLVSAHAGDKVAERIVLNHMLPKAVHYARTSRAIRSMCTSGSVDAVGTAIGAMWQAIAQYKLERTSRVHATLGLNALNLITTSIAHSPATCGSPVDDEYLEYAIHDIDGTDSLESQWGDDSFNDLVTLLRWAIDTDTLTPDEVKLLAGFDLGTLDDRQRLADDLHVNRDSLTRRVYRIRRKLLTAVQEYIRTHGSW